MLIRILETLFPKTMREYWYSGRRTGYRYGLNSVRAIIIAEIKQLDKNKDVHSRTKASELNYVLSKIKDVF